MWIESRQALALVRAGSDGEPRRRPTFRITGCDRRSRACRGRGRRSRSIATRARRSRGAARRRRGAHRAGDCAARIAAARLADAGDRRVGALADSITRKLIAALDAIPAGIKVGAIIASEPMQQQSRWRLGPRRRKKRSSKLLRSASFVGGQDNAPALAEALQVLEAEPNATLLWVHGPQPVSFRGSAAGLEQADVAPVALARCRALQRRAGARTRCLPDAPWAWSRALAAANRLAPGRSRRLLPARAGRGQTLAIRRRRRGTAEGLAKGSDHIARLWAQRPRARADADQSGRQPRRRRGARHPISARDAGQRRRRARNQAAIRREPPHARVSQATVPTIPEPHEWALLLIACAALAWLAWQRPAAVAVAA